MKQNARDFIVRIESPEGFGSGFLYSPPADASAIYIVTARHNLFSKVGLKFGCGDIKIGFLNETDWNFYQCLNSDQIIAGSNNEKEDIGIIIIEKEKLPISLNFNYGPKLCEVVFGASPEVTGFPKFVENNWKRTLYKLTFLDERDYENQIQMEVADPPVELYNADALVGGYSGAPILVSSLDQSYFCGIFLSYRKVEQRIRGINFALINSLLSAVERPPVEIVKIETDAGVLKSVQSLKANSERILSRVRQSIGSISLGRETIAKKISDLVKGSKMLIVTGVPGVGKSALVKKVLNELKDGYLIIALQGEQLDRTSIDEIFHVEPFNIASTFEVVLDSPANQGTKIILIDSVEKILETENGETILDFFELLNKRDDIKLVLTCRTYAIELLQIRFLREFPAYVMIDVPLLDKEEMEKVLIAFPQVGQLLANEALTNIIKNPFNLDKAVSLPVDVLANPISSEKEFSHIMWDYVIRNEGREKDAQKRNSRAEVFSGIAVNRALAMVAYTSAGGASPNILNDLIADHIIDFEPNLKQSYAATHDIYEDWALTRFIEKYYLQYIIDNNELEEFYTSLGSTPAIRRAFRIWFSEKIQKIDYQINDLLKSTLKQKEIARYWKDEILASVIQSNHCNRFLQENRDFVLDNNGEVFRRIVFILKMSCQRPNPLYLKVLEPEERIEIYQNQYLLPVGQGWSSLIEFVSENIEQLSGNYSFVIDLVMQWKKGLNNGSKRGPEARAAALVILYYFNNVPSEEKRIAKQDMQDIVTLLFRLTKEVKNELRDFLERAIDNENSEANSRLRDVYKAVVEVMLSGYENANVCSAFPELVIKLMKEKWFYFPPTEQELEERRRNSSRLYIPDAGSDREHDFGLRKSTNSSYFPATPEQTPILNLLFWHPTTTLKFLIEFLNHVGEAFRNSTYAESNFMPTPGIERKTIELLMDDGSKNSQLGNIVLWTAFRGNIITVPNVLQSVLMALESYLLFVSESLSKTDPDTEVYLGRVWEAFYLQLLKQTNTVMSTSVLLSVASKYPNLAVKYILPALRNRQIYYWDFQRRGKDSGIQLSPRSFKRDARSRQKALSEFQTLPHRKKTLRDLIFAIDSEETERDIFKVIDHLYTIDPSDKEWQILVSGLDKRKYEVVARKGNFAMLQPKLDSELEAVRTEVRTELQADENISAIGLWCMKKLKNKKVENDTYQTWKEHFTLIRWADLENIMPKNRLQCGLIAGIGLRDFYDQMNEDEKEWCLEKFDKVLRYEVLEAHSNTDFMHMEYTPFETQSIFSVLPKVMYFSIEQMKNELKQFIFHSLIHLYEKSSKDALILSVRTFLWEKDRAFVINCIKGMVRYAQLSRFIMVAQNRPSVDPQVPTVGKRFKSRLKKIKNLFGGKKDLVSDSEFDVKVDNVQVDYSNLFYDVCQSDVEVNLDELDKSHTVFDYYFEVLKIIPADTDEAFVQKLYERLIELALDNIDKYKEGGFGMNDKLHFEIVQKFERELARYLISQKNDIALATLKTLVDWIYEPANEKKLGRKSSEFVEGVMENLIIFLTEDRSRNDNFWLLWKYLAGKNAVKKVYSFEKLLLFNYQFIPDTKDWVILRGRKDLMGSIITKGSDIESSARLVAGVGFTELIPDALEWLADHIKKEPISGNDTIRFFERIVIQCYYSSKLRETIKGSTKLRNAFIEILEQLIEETASSSAYMIREDFISHRKA